MNAERIKKGWLCACGNVHPVRPRAKRFWRVPLDVAVNFETLNDDEYALLPARPRLERVTLYVCPDSDDEWASEKRPVCVSGQWQCALCGAVYRERKAAEACKCDPPF